MLRLYSEMVDFKESTYELFLHGVKLTQLWFVIIWWLIISRPLPHLLVLACFSIFSALCCRDAWNRWLKYWSFCNSTTFRLRPPNFWHKFDKLLLWAFYPVWDEPENDPPESGKVEWGTCTLLFTCFCQPLSAQLLYQILQFLLSIGFLSFL